MKYVVKEDHGALPKGTEIETYELAWGLQFDPREGKWYGDEDYLGTNPHLFKAIPEVKEGQYWKSNSEGFPLPKNEVLRISEVDETHASYKSINSSSSGNTKISSFIKYAIPLSDDEVEQALIEERNSRGFLRGAKVKCLFTGNTCTIDRFTHSSNVNIKDDDMWVLSEVNIGVCIYKEGKWAEIIEDEWKVKERIVGNDFYLTNGDREIYISCRVFVEGFSKQEAEAIRDALNNLSE